MNFFSMKYLFVIQFISGRKFQEEKIRKIFINFIEQRNTKMNAFLESTKIILYSIVV